MRVLTTPCDACPFKGRFLGLRPGRLRDIVETCKRDDTHFPCQQTVDYGAKGGPDTTRSAVCAGWLEAVGGLDQAPGQLLRIAGRLNAFEMVEP